MPREPWQRLKQGSKHEKPLAIAALILMQQTVPATASERKPALIRFPSGERTLGGELFLPEGKGPFPTVLFSHGSAPGMTNSYASATIAPEFTKNGWAFFMPYRRGQGLSEVQGVYIMDAVNAAKRKGPGKAEEKLLELHTTDHLDDQLAALAWLKDQDFVDDSRVATVGNSFGGIQIMLGMEEGGYCAGVNAAGAAQAWGDAAQLQARLLQAAAGADGPIFFFQASNDYDTAASLALHKTMQKAGKASEVVIYPAFGSSEADGHSLPYRGVSVWFTDALRFLNKHCQAASRRDKDTANSADTRPVERQ